MEFKLALFKNDDKKEKDKFWFVKVATNAAIAGGAFYGFKKVKGPAGSIIKKITDTNINTTVEKEAAKYIKTSEEFSNGYNPFDEDDLINPNIPDQMMTMTESLISSSEDSLISEINTLSNTDKEFGEKFSIFYSRFNSLEKYAISYGLDGEDAHIILALRSVVQKALANGVVDDSIISKVNSLHEKYLKQNAYGVLYQSQLHHLKNNARKVVFDNMSSKDVLKKSILGDVTTDLSSKVESHLLADLFKRNKSIEEFVPGQINSALTHELGSTISSFKKTVDYNPLLTRIDDKLSLIEAKPNSSITSHAIQIARDTNGKQWAHINITLNSGKTHTLEVPLAKNMIVPGSNSTVSSYVDMLFTFGGSPASPYQNVKSALNSSEYILHTISKRLDTNSSFMSEFISDTSNAIHRLNNEINGILDNLTIYQGKPGQLILQLYNPEYDKLLHQNGEAGQRQYDKMNRALNNMSMMNRMVQYKKEIKSGRIGRVFIVSLDTETIMASQTHIPGLEHTARNPQTHLVQIGIDIAEVNNSMTPKVVESKRFYSDHATNALKKDNLFDTKQMEFIRKVTPGVDASTSIDEVISKYTEHIKLKTDQTGTRAANDTQFADSLLDYLDQFFEHSKTGKLGINDKVVIVTKNGQQYDLPLIKLHATKMKWNKFERKYKNMIDTGSLGVIESKYNFDDSPLGLDSVMKGILNRTGFGDPNVDFNNPKVIGSVLDHFERKGYLTIDNNVKKQLQGALTQTHGEAVVDALFNIVIYQDMFLKASTKRGIWDTSTQLKLRKVNDMFHGSASIYENVLTRMENDSAYFNGKLFTGFLSSANRATKGALYEESAGALYAFGGGSNLSKQIYQNLSGHTLSRNINISPKKGRNIFRKTLTTLPAVELHLKREKANKQAGLYRGKGVTHNSITVKSAQVIYSAAETEGLAILSTDIAKQVNVLHDMNVNISSINFSGNSTDVGPRIDKFKNILLDAMLNEKSSKPGSIIDINRLAKRIASRPDINLARLPRGTTIGSGDLGQIILKHTANIEDFEITPIDVNGRIDLDIRVKISRKARVDGSEAWKARDISGNKSVLTYSDPSQKINGLYGHDFRTEAKWIKDGNVSAFKDSAVNKIIGTLQEQIYSGDRKQSIQAKWQLRKFAREIGADIVKDELILNPYKMKKTKYKHLGKKEEQLAHAIYGALDISLDTINRYMKPVGSTWSSERLKEFYANFGGGDYNKGRSIAKRLADSMYDKAVSKLKNASQEALYSVSKGDVLKVEEEYRRIADSIYQPKEGDTIFAEWANSDPNVKSSHKSLIFSSFSEISLHSGSITGEGFGYHTLKMSNNVVDHILRSDYISKTTKDMVSSNRVYYRDDIKAKAKKSLDKFKREVFAEASMATHLDLNEINKLLSRPGTEMLSSNNLAKSIDEELKKNIAGYNIEADDILIDVKDSMMTTIEKYKDHLVMIDNELDDPEKFREYKEKLVSNIISHHRMETALKKQSKFVTYEETSVWAKMAKEHNNIFRISNSVSGLPAVFDIDMNKTFNSIYGSTNYSKQQKNLFVKMLNDMLKYQQKNKVDGPIISIDGDNVKLRELFIPAHDVAANIADKVAGPIARETPETYSSKRFLQSVVSYANGLTMQGWTDVNAKSSYETMIKFWTMHILDTTIGNKSVYGQWQSSNLKVQQFKSKGAENLYIQALEIKNAGGMKAIAKDKNVSADYIRRGNEILEQILNSKFNTTFISETAFKKMKVDIGAGLSTSSESYLKSLSTKQDNLYKRIVSGEQKMIGFSTRYPNEPQGQHAMMDTMIQVIPDEYKKYFLMDDWSAYTYDIFTQMIKMDHDGDVNNIGLTNVNTIEKFRTHRKEIKNKSKLLFQKITNVIEKQKYDYHTWMRPIGLDENGVMDILTFDKVTYSPRVIKKELTQASTDELAELFAGDNMSAFIAGYGTQLPEFMTGRGLNAIRVQAASAAATKDTMGIATNSVMRANIAMKAGLVKDQHIINDFFGDMKTGLGRFLQDVTGITKNPTLEKIISLSRQLEVLHGKTSDLEAVEQFKDSYIKTFENEAKSLGDEYDLFLNKKGSFYENKKNQIDTYIMVNKIINTANRNSVTFRDAYKQVVQSEMNSPSRGLTSIFNQPEDIGRDDIFAGVLENARQNHFYETSSIFDEFSENFKNKIKLSHPIINNSKKFAKYGAIGASVFLAANFFRSNQLSSSANPLDMFVDLDNNINSDNNIFSSDLQLDRGSSLEMVDASFSKKAFVRMNKIQQGKMNQYKSKQINSILGSMSENYSNTGFNVSNRDIVTNANYTSHIGKFGNNNIVRKRKYGGY